MNMFFHSLLYILQAVNYKLHVYFKVYLYFLQTELILEEYEKEIEDQAEELREFGEVQWKVYWGYFRSGGACVLLVLMLVLFLFVQLISSFADWWLTVW